MVDGSEKMKVELEAGTYLVEGSLLIVSNYGGDYDELEDDYGNYQEFKFNGYLQMKVIVYSNGKVSKEYEMRQAVDCSGSGYETPVYFSQPVKVEKGGAVAIVFAD